MPATKKVRTMTHIARFSFPHNSTVVYHLKDDKNVIYICTLNENGTDGCYDMSGTQCKAHQHGRSCYHTQEARRIESERTVRFASDPEPAPAKRPISEAPLHHNEEFSLLKRTR